MDKRIESYLDSVIPEKLSKRRQKLIREELRDHISDHIDFYTEIGYSEDESIQKALADMGDDGGVTAMVKKDFEKVYGEKIWMPILAFVLTMLMLFAAIYCGVWILSADSKGSPGVFEVIASFAIILVMSFAMVFAYRKGLKKTLRHTESAVRRNSDFQRLHSARDICAHLRCLSFARRNDSADYV